jgi:hypothetical protein
MINVWVLIAQWHSQQFIESYQGGKMSAPEDRLIDDAEVEDLQRLAVAVLTQHQHFDRVAWQFALGMLALIRDRRARQELAAIGYREQTV